MASEPHTTGPVVDNLDAVFQVYEVRKNGDKLVYYGEPRVPRETLMERLWPVFRRQGYEIMLTRQTGEYVLVAEPITVGVNGVPWTNILLLVATVLTTLWVGAVHWYYVKDLSAHPLRLLSAWPFTVA